jgi:hypothetical protein
MAGRQKNPRLGKCIRGCARFAARLSIAAVALPLYYVSMIAAQKLQWLASALSSQAGGSGGASGQSEIEIRIAVRSGAPTPASPPGTGQGTPVPSTAQDLVSTEAVPHTHIPSPPQGAETLAPGVWKCPGDVTGSPLVGSTQSSRYHYGSCRWAQAIHVDHRLCFTSAQAAQAYGYTPCSTCGPP